MGTNTPFSPRQNLLASLTIFPFGINTHLKIFVLKKKKKTLSRLADIQNFLSYYTDNQLLSLEKELQDHYNTILKNEEVFWMLKSRMTWFSLGDKNTNFFHRTTLIKRRRNKITQLLIGENSWIYDPCEIGIEIRNSLIATLSQHNTTLQPKTMITFS